MSLILKQDFVSNATKFKKWVIIIISPFCIIFSDSRTFLYKLIILTSEGYLLISLYIFITNTMPFWDIKLAKRTSRVHMQPSVNTSTMEMVSTWELSNLHTIFVRRNTYTTFLYQNHRQLCQKMRITPWLSKDVLHAGDA